MLVASISIENVHEMNPNRLLFFQTFFDYFYLEFNKPINFSKGSCLSTSGIANELEVKIIDAFNTDAKIAQISPKYGYDSGIPLNRHRQTENHSSKNGLQTQL